MNSLNRDFVEEGFDVRLPFAIGMIGCQAMHKGLGVDRIGTRGVDRFQDETDPRLCRRRPLEGPLESSAQRLDVVNGNRRHLDLDASDFTLFLLCLPIPTDTSGNGAICHSGSPRLRRI